MPAASVHHDRLTAGGSIADEAAAKKVYPKRLAADLIRVRHNVPAAGPIGKSLRRRRRGGDGLDCGKMSHTAPLSLNRADRVVIRIAPRRHAMRRASHPSAIPGGRSTQ